MRPMNVTLKLFATLGDYLPPGANRNEVGREVNEGATVRDVLNSLSVPIEKCHLILINGVYLAPKRAAQRQLLAGDTVAVWPPVAGG